ncbi:NlpC/P60 family protein [Dryocola clanedunensis]|uniref:NlpC/P60 family protein n=1 Tax=Cedecea sulfonylureivorans TaxID=3051154 RepID=UPI001928E8C2
MARITKRSITLCALLFTLPLTPLTHASEHARSASAQKAHAAKKSTVKNKTSKSKIKASSTTKKSSSQSVAAVKKKKTDVKSKPLATASSKKSLKKTTPVSKTQTIAAAQHCTKARKGHKAKCTTVKTDKNLTIAQAHKARVLKAQKTAMNKLMNQIGKPYRWGGTSPRTGFDCSGLVYYAYKDLVKFRIPRTANEMYHLRDAAAVGRGELQSGDLVFFRTRGRGTADHVGVYVGNGKFIQSPRTGRDIQITSLSEDYWQRHYVGARRVMTPKTIR